MLISLLDFRHLLFNLSPLLAEGAMNGVISGRDVLIVVASVLIGGGVTSDDGLVDETSVKGAITRGVDVTV
ncbi:hypothetical protein Tco_1295267 [Tanacetum coccineum]